MAIGKKSTIKNHNKFKEFGFFLLDILYNAAIIILLVVLIRSYVISPFRVVGSSMDDTLHDQEFIIIDKLSYIIGDIERGDPVVFLPPPMSKDNPKFQENTRSNQEGVAVIDIEDLRVENKQKSYCTNDILGSFWFCKLKPEANDYVYFAPQEELEGSNALETNWNEVRRFNLNKLDIKQGYLELLDVEPDTNYTVRIYDTTGPEHFVKRVIGIPGDTVKIENGRVYLMTKDDSEFTEIEEPYLNQENSQQTYIINQKGQNTFSVPEGHFFVMGDNRNHSNDSRSWLEPITQDPFPFVPEANINGKVLMVLWPLGDLHFVRSADY